MADDDILALNQLIRDYGTEYQAPKRLRMPMKERLYADYTPASKTEQAEMLLSMLPGIGEGLDIAHMTKDVQEENYGQAGLSGLAMVLPGVGAATIKKIGKPVINKFTTSRGSTYELFDDASTQRNRSGVGHTDTSTGLQPPSIKTVFVDKKGLIDVGGVFQNPDIATRLDPVFDDKGNITSMTLRLTENFGPRPAGDTLAEVPVTTRPEVGKYPVEIFNPVSPKGSRGGGVHFGNNIVEVQSVDAPTQAISSADTSLRQVPALFKKQDIDFPEGGTNFDIGGGRFDEGTKYLADERGVENFVYDPYNRSPEHNAAVMDRMRTEAADTATAANVLNVIAEPEARADVIRQAMTNIKPGGTAYFQIYEGAGTGVGKVTSKGFQNNKKTADYIGEVEEIFGPDNVRRKGNVIIATKPVQYRRGGSVVSRNPYRRQPRTI